MTATDGAEAGNDWFTAIRGSDIETVRRWLAQGADASQCDMHGYTALHVAVAAQSDAEVRRRVDILAALYASGANPLAQACDGNTPLHSLVEASDTTGVAWAVSRGGRAALLARNYAGATALALALRADGGRATPAGPCTCEGERVACSIVLALQDLHISPTDAVGQPATGAQIADLARARGWETLAAWVGNAMRHTPDRREVRRRGP